MSISTLPYGRPPAVATLVTLCLACSGVSASEADNAELLSRVQSPQTSLHDKATALEDLAIQGGPASVRSLAELIDDPRLSHYARYALQTNPDSAAGDALRKALGRVRGKLLVGVINSVASRNDQQAVGPLSGLLRSKDIRVAVAAAGALATIGSDAALAALEDSPTEHTVAFADALLQAALVLEQKGELEQAAAILTRLSNANPPAHVNQAASLALLRTVEPEKAHALLAKLLASPTDWQFVVGLQAAAQAGPSSYAKELSRALPTGTPERQVRVLAALETKTEGVSLEAVRDASESQSANVRIAAATALGALGDSSDGPLLVRVALKDPEANEAAIEALIRIKDPQLDKYLIAMLENAGPSQQALAAKVIGLRRSKAATGELFSKVNSSDSAEVRLAALGALRRLAPGPALGQVLDLAKNAQSPDEAHAARQASVEVALRSADSQAAVATVAQRLKDWPSDKHGVLLDVLARIGGHDSLRIVAEAADSPQRETQNQATRVLGTWPSADAAPVLIRLASSEHPYAVRALRGYLRIARQYHSGEERLVMCGRALEIASREEERLLALQVLALSPSAESLRLAVSQLSSDTLGSKASETVVAIAEAASPASPEEAREAARAVILTGGSEQVIARARKLIDP